VVVDPVVVDEDQQSSSGVSAAVTADDVLHQRDPFHIQSNRQETSPNLPDQEIEIVSGKPELEQAAFPQATDHGSSSSGMPEPVPRFPEPTPESEPPLANALWHRLMTTGQAALQRSRFSEAEQAFQDALREAEGHNLLLGKPSLSRRV
jgi:hypothetical protein